MNLEKLYKMQEKLDKYIIKNRKIVMNEEELLDKTILALLVEVGELANATRCFKHWSLKGPESKERLLDELADCWHFYLSIGNQLNLSYKRTENEDNNIHYIAEHELLELIFINIYNDISNIAALPIPRMKLEYTSAGICLHALGMKLGFTDAEIEQAYLKKHEENYRRQREGY